tara:strand:- start:36452 stop:37522 length:1071 start_codon:yes stop_codon:yes gene_type:complete
MITTEIIQQTLAKFGAMLLVGFLGTDHGNNDIRRIEDHIGSGKVGGVLLLHRNIQEGPKKLKNLIHQFKMKAPADRPLLVAIDGEGGVVKRLMKEDGYDIQLPSAKKLAQMSTADSDKLLQVYMKQLSDLGINWNLAPVVDVEVATETGCIGRLERSFSKSPKKVAYHGYQLIQAIQEAGMAFCLKHWPGLGADVGDTHKGMTNLTNVWSRERDAEPFNLIVKEISKNRPNKTIPVMTAHSVHEGLDSGAPSLTFSEQVIEGQRKKWQAEVLFVSDDLDMGALDGFELGEKVVRAILAGNDVLIFSQYRNYDPEKVDKIYQSLQQALEKNDKQAEMLIKRINESFNRIEKFKADYL